MRARSTRASCCPDTAHARTHAYTHARVAAACRSAAHCAAADFGGTPRPRRERAVPAPFASWILQRQLTEMKEAAVTAMRNVGELADLVRFLPGFFGSITSHVKKRTSRAPEMGHFAAYKPHCGAVCGAGWLYKTSNNGRANGKRPCSAGLWSFRVVLSQRGIYVKK